jgi:hypothetical protein
MLAGAVAAWPLTAQAPVASTPRLVLPVRCEIGGDCVIQNYVDLDPSPGVRDYQCRGRTYQAHDGIDFRVRTMARQQAGIAVLAAADGTVLRIRDGVVDRSVKLAAPGAVQGQECGNGLVIDHGGGWTTQYCHMAQGSLSVRPGQLVTAGTPIGRVGLSGNTEYPHLHMTLRQGDKAVDPFAYGAAPGSCGGGRSLWASPALAKAYARGEVLNTGFATAPVTMDQATERGTDQRPRPDRNAPALVAFVQAIGLEAGDQQRLTVIGPGGLSLGDNVAPPLDRNKAQTITFAGRKRPPTGWPAGTYTARYTVTRQGQVALRTTFNIALP